MNARLTIASACVTQERELAPDCLSTTPIFRTTGA
jgi:hypothetical protein